MSLYSVLARRTWEDPEPDRVTISVECSRETGEAFVVFTGNCTWLPPSVVDDEVMPWLGYCVKRAMKHNLELKRDSIV